MAEAEGFSAENKEVADKKYQDDNQKSSQAITENAGCNAEQEDVPGLKNIAEKSATSTKDVDNLTDKADPPPSIRHDWYQTETHVVISFMVKKCNKDDAHIEIGKQSLSVDIKLPSNRKYNMELDLAHAVATDECITKVLSTKVEVKLKKEEAIWWPSLESKDNVKYSKLEEAVPPCGESKVRQYPTSSSKYHDWDKLAANIETDEKDEKKEGDAALNDLFQKIYKDADDDTRRAMNKSFQESGGTVLSTNWKDIGAKKVECKPPDGMEYKKYEY